LFGRVQIRCKEEIVSRVLQQHGFSYPVELSYASVGEGAQYINFPYIRPSHFISKMSQTGDLHRLLAGHGTLKAAEGVLQEFWARWKMVHPSHEVFSSKVPLKHAVPIFLHGDEGQHYKKSAVLISSFQPAIGYGSKRRPLEKALPPEIEQAGIPLNFLRTAFQTRFLTAVAPKDRVVITPCF